MQNPNNNLRERLINKRKQFITIDGTKNQDHISDQQQYEHLNTEGRQLEIDGKINKQDIVTKQKSQKSSNRPNLSKIPVTHNVHKIRDDQNQQLTPLPLGQTEVSMAIDDSGNSPLSDVYKNQSPTGRMARIGLPKLNKATIETNNTQVSNSQGNARKQSSSVNNRQDTQTSGDSPPPLQPSFPNLKNNKSGSPQSSVDIKSGAQNIKNRQYLNIYSAKKKQPSVNQNANIVDYPITEEGTPSIKNKNQQQNNIEEYENSTGQPRSSNPSGLGRKRQRSHELLVTPQKYVQGRNNLAMNTNEIANNISSAGALQVLNNVQQNYGISSGIISGQITNQNSNEKINSLQNSLQTQSQVSLNQQNLQNMKLESTSASQGDLLKYGEQYGQNQHISSGTQIPNL